MGMCVAGGAYLPGHDGPGSDDGGQRAFLAGPALVQAAIGQNILQRKNWAVRPCTPKFLRHGGFQGADERPVSASLRLRSLGIEMGSFGACRRSIALRSMRITTDRASPAASCMRLLDPDPAKAAVNSYDMHERDRTHRGPQPSSMSIGTGYGRTLLCGYARIGGHQLSASWRTRKLPQPQTSHSGGKAPSSSRCGFMPESADKAAPLHHGLQPET